MKVHRLLLVVICLTALGSLQCNAQVSDLDNFSFDNTDYLGWDINTGFDLEIKHEGPYSIKFFTNNSEGMRLTNSGNLFIGQLPVLPERARLDVLGRNVGIRGLANNTSGQNYGGYFEAEGGVDNYGVFGVAETNIIGTSVGVGGQACNGQTASYAVYGLSCSNIGQNWAGWFDGKTFCSSGAWDASDENLKTNIVDLENATDLLMSLQPKSYEFDQSIEALTLPAGMQYGLIAQDLQEVVPHAVTSATSPPRYDEEGNITAESLDFLAVNYTQLIPVLVAGFREQNAAETSNLEAINDLQERLAQVENSLAIHRQASSVNEMARMEDYKVELDQNSPNPFGNETQISYTVRESGQIKVDVINDNGEVIATLQNDHQGGGNYSLLWNATEHPSGVYFCVIRHDGKVQVKKMIKQ